MNPKILATRWLPPILWMGLIFFLSSQPTLPSATKIWGDFIFKKLAHITVYAILYFLLVRATGKKTPQSFLFAFAITFLYAVSDEYHQSLVPGRHPSPIDVGYDTIGAAIAYLRLNKYL